jgi:molybdopterin-guanine dinucleotide biosynthesis protein A
MIDWHGKAQREYMAEVLTGICDDVFISCRDDQQQQVTNHKMIADNFTDLGPYGAILSAFRENPNVAWLVVASDLPLVDKQTLQYLADNRNISAVATTFESPFDGLPEPLITIWEPKAYAILLSFLAQGYSCPRKALRNNNVHIIRAQHPEKLMNVNTQKNWPGPKNYCNKKRLSNNASRFTPI